MVENNKLFKSQRSPSFLFTGKPAWMKMEICFLNLINLLAGWDNFRTFDYLGFESNTELLLEESECLLRIDYLNPIRLS